MAIKTIEERFKRGEINKVLIFVPNTLVLNWTMELEKFLDVDFQLLTLRDKNRAKRVKQLEDFIKSDLNFQTIKELRASGLKGKNKADILEGYKPKLQILLLNYEKSWSMEKEIKKFKAQYLICDESHFLKTSTSNTTKSIRRLTKTFPFKTIMTGDPIPNGLKDLYSQFEILDPNILGDWSDFKRTYIRMGGFMGKEIIGYKNEDRIKKIIRKNSFRVLLRDCIDLPPTIEHKIYCELEVKKHYNEMKEDLYTAVEGMIEDKSRLELKNILKENGVVYHPRESYTSLLLKAQDYISASSCEMAITQITRLQQISGGFLTLDSGEIVQVGREKLDATKSLIEGLNTPIVIFSKFIPEIETLTVELSKMKKHGKPLVVKSFRDKKMRDTYYKDFQDGKIDILILQYKSGSVGLNLQNSSNMILYSHTHDAGQFEQSISRIVRNGQKKTTNIFHILVKDSIDEEVFASVNKKIKYSHKILNVI